MKKIEKIKNIISITCLIATLDICIVPWISLSINNYKLSHILWIVSIIGAIAIVICMYAGLVLRIIEDKKQDK
jgi:apolipoprotein N-acyltransferase